ncbi:MAG TPA: zf-HC2 domain-containing protein [Streptosporangiaceae bacterium]|jgi:hypothetical protein|nr:zf-HC2 domain-containing protein [Streptosporangiaceae bacterium]
MSEMNEMSCRELQDVAAELALGVLTGRERAQAIAHLDHCEACRENVRQLTQTGEGLLGLLPAMEPAAGFETRVLDRIGLSTPDAPPAPAPRRQFGRTRRMLAVAAAVAGIIVGGLGGWALHNGTSSPTPTALDSAALVSVSHQAVGKIYLYRGRPQWLYMSVHLRSGNGMVLCQVESRSGQISTVGSFRLTGGYGYWGSPAPGNPAPGNPGSLKGARLVTPDGTVLATASF